MKKLLIAFVVAATILPVVSLAAYTRTPSGTASSTSFVFHTASTGDMPGWGGGGSWRYVFGRINLTDPIDGGSNHGACHTTGAVDETLSAADLGWTEPAQVGGVQYREYSDGACSSASNNGVMEGANSWWSVAPTQSIFAFETPATSTMSTSTLNAGDRVLTYIFFIIDALWFFGVAAGFLAALMWLYNIKK